MSRVHRILVSRTDRLGDVMMALPSLEYLRAVLEEAEIDFMAKPELEELLRPFLASRRIRFVPYPAATLVGWCRERAYSGALILHDALPVLLGCARARIPLRVGPLSKPASFFLLKGGLRQRRSDGIRNEGQYNLDLARHFAQELLGRPIPAADPSPVEIPGDEASAREAQTALAAAGLDEERGFLILHPGMGGSALNLSAAKYVELIDTAAEIYSCQIALSEGPAPVDREMVEAIVKRRPGLKVVRGLRLPVLREVFRRARLVVAPSTGPLHLAHYVGTRTLGVYPPLLSQCKERWAPWGGAAETQVFSPDVRCPGRSFCLGAKCEHYFCMDKLAWSRLLSPVQSDLTGREG